MALPAGVGAEGRAAVDHVGAPRPYLRYFSSHRPTDDHGTRPSILIVFDDEIVQTHFLRLARDEMQARGVAVPLWVSHRGTIEQMGPLGGRAWRAPDDWQSPQAMPPQ